MVSGMHPHFCRSPAVMMFETIPALCKDISVDQALAHHDGLTASPARVDVCLSANFTGLGTGFSNSGASVLIGESRSGLESWDDYLDLR